MDKEQKNINNSDSTEQKQNNIENSEDIFTTPFIGIKVKKTNKSFFFKLSNHKKKIIIITGGLILLFIILIIFRSKDGNLFNREIYSIRNYSTGLEANIESFLFFLHNDEPLPDSVKFYFSSILYIDLNFQENCGLKRLKELLSKRGFVHSIVIESKTFKDFGVNSWIYRTNFKEGDFINAEYIIDFEYKNDTIFPKSFELLSETRKVIENINIPPKDSVNVKKKKKETELIIIDSAAKRKVDSIKRVESKKEEKDLKEIEIKEGIKEEDKIKEENKNEKELIKKKEQDKEDKKVKDEEK